MSRPASRQPAVRYVLERARWAPRDLDRTEINEAFAVVPLVVAKGLGLPEDIINVDGGAMMHGHPTGTVLTARLLHAMRRGMVTLCSGGHGIALALDAL